MNTATDPSSASPQILVLASQSPRRAALLQQLGYEPVCCPVPIDETPNQDESPKELVLRLATEKAWASYHRGVLPDEISGNRVIVAADTVIDLHGNTLGKPSDERDAIEMLLSLSDKEHLVHTGVCIVADNVESQHALCVSTKVQFAKITTAQAERYWLSGEPADKAGAYAIQGLGSQFVVKISGSYSGVVGLPLYETSRILSELGVGAVEKFEPV